MSFARNFALGQQIAKTAMDTYDQARQNKEFADIQNARPEFSEGYTAEAGDQLAALANARDQQGNPYYQLEARDNGSYGLRMRGEDGAYNPVEGATFAPRQVGDFLGQRYTAESLTPDRMEGLRARAMAGALSKTDPIRGIGLLQQVKSGERDDERFGWEKQAQPLKQRAAELQVSGAERTERQGVRADDIQSVMDEGAKLTDDKIAELFPQLNSKAMAGLPIYDAGDVLGPDGKPTGFRTIRIAGQDGKSQFVDLNPAQQRNLATAYLLQSKGYGAESLAKLTEVNKDIADTVDRYNKTVAATTTSGNDAAYKSGSLRNDTARVGIAQTTASAQRDYYGALRDRAQRPDAANLREFQNDKGESVMVDITGLPRRPDGTIPLPSGLKPRTTKPTVTPDAYFQALERANNVYGDPARARMAVDQMFGLTAPTNQVAESLKALNDKKGGVKNQSAPTAAPAAPLGLNQRLGNAIGADNTAGNRNQFDTLAAEAERAVPAYSQQITVLRNALDSTRSPGERANLENRIAELEGDLTIYSNILQQRAAQRGY